ncbi:hypothetical protein HED60_07440 [Planctomycetales bacterium ZRK34]|nr:hypothetical protein HED60_07440 [Planctomycetales bacterium ZRK34]
MRREAVRLLAIGLLIGGMAATTQAASLEYDYNAGLDTAGNGSWENELSATVVRTWAFQPSGSYSPTAISSSATDFTQAYEFGSGINGATASSFGSSDISGASAAFEFWIKPTDLTGDEVIFESGGATHGTALLLSGSNLTFYTRNNFNNTDVTVGLTSGDISDVMQVVSAVDGGSGQTVVYVNGIARNVKAGTQNWSQGTDAAGLGRIGNDLGALDSSGSYGVFNGQVAQARLYNGNITGYEVANAYSEHSTAAPDAYAAGVLADSPVAYYRFGEQAGSEGVVSYGTALGVGGTDVGAGVTHGAAALASNTDTGSVHFDGTSYIEVPNSDDLNTGGSYNQKGIQLWFNADSVPGSGDHAVLYEQGGQTNGLNVYLSDGQLYMGGWIDSSNQYLSTAVTGGQDYFVQMSWDATSGELQGWVNGVLIGRDTSGINPMPAHTGTIGIGGLSADTQYHDGDSSTGTDYFTGSIDELALYNTAPSRATAQETYVAGGGDIGIAAGSTFGAIVNYNAGYDSGNSTWVETTTQINQAGDPTALDWNMTGATRQTGVSSYAGITAAFEFTTGSKGVYPAIGGNDSWSDLVLGDPTNDDATIELWFKPDDLTGKEVLFETGGTTTGTSIRLNGDLLEVAVKYQSESRLLTFDLDVDDNGIDFTDFIQVSAVFDLTNDVLRLFVDGLERDTSVFNGPDWDGGDAAAIGNFENGLGAAGTGYGQYFGQMAILRLYGEVLSTQDIRANFSAITGVPVPEPASFMVLGLSSLMVLRRRRG